MRLGGARRRASARSTRRRRGSRGCASATRSGRCAGDSPPRGRGGRRARGGRRGHAGGPAAAAPARARGDLGLRRHVRAQPRRARRGEQSAADVYALVYEAERPEIFLKDAAGRRTVGPGDAVGVRADSTWTVPEPELGLVLGADGVILAVHGGNDLTARDIEGANPLYLPQAKLFARLLCARPRGARA